MTFNQYCSFVQGPLGKLLGYYLGGEWTEELVDLMDNRHPFLRSSQVLQLRLSLGCFLCSGLICQECAPKNTLKSHGYYPDGQDKDRKPARNQTRIPSGTWIPDFLGDLNASGSETPINAKHVFDLAEHGQIYRKETGYSVPQDAFPCCLPCLANLKISKCANCTAVRSITPSATNEEPNYSSVVWYDCPTCPLDQKNVVCSDCKIGGCHTCRAVRLKAKDTIKSSMNSAGSQQMKSKLCQTI